MVDCGGVVFDAGEMLDDMKGPLLAASSQPEQSRDVLPHIVPYVPDVRRDITAIRQRVVAAGFAASYPAVRDLDAMIATLGPLTAAAKAKRLDAMPKIYLDLNSALEQWTFDSRYVCAS